MTEITTGFGIIGATVAVVVSALSVAYLANPASPLRWMDRPNERSMHALPIPRTGGLGILLGLAAGWFGTAVLISPPSAWIWLLSGIVVVAAVSMLDDARGLGVLPRLAAHVLAAGLLLGAGWHLEASTIFLPGQLWEFPPKVGAALIVLFTIWMVNLYNFMDGIDGLAAGMAIIGFSTMGLLGFLGGDPTFAALNLTVAMAAAGFLLFNLPPARIFMGDTGASVFGFLAATSMLWAQYAGLFPLWAGLLLFSPFIVDATGTLLVRILAKKRFWEAHRQHCYQQFARSALGPKRTLYSGYALMLAAAVSAVLATCSESAALQTFTLLGWTLAYAVLCTTLWAIRSRQANA